MFDRFPLRRALLGAALTVLAGAAGAQTGDWPNRPIRLVVAGPVVTTAGFAWHTLPLTLVQVLPVQVLPVPK